MAGWRASIGKPRVPLFAAAGGAAALLLWVVVVALNPVTRPRTGNPSASAPQASESSGTLPVGPFLLWEGPGAGLDIGVRLTSAGWLGTPGEGTVLKNDNPDDPNAAGLVVFTGTGHSLTGRRAFYVYRDACRWSETRPETPVATVDEAVAAFSSQAASEPAIPLDVAVGGRAGKAVTLRVPADVQIERCDQGTFRFFIEGADNPRTGFVPGQIDELWIVSAPNDAGPVIFDLVYDEAISPALVDELREMVESATFR